MTDAMRLYIDRAGNVASGNARLLSLNAEAGGKLDSPLALPQIAAIARLAATLQMPIARQVVIGAEGEDIALQIDARPHRGGVEVTACNWQARLPRQSWLSSPPQSTSAPTASSWQWHTDAALNLTRLTLSGETDTEARSFLDRPLTRFVRLIEDDTGDLPLLRALAEGSGFTDQRAVRRDMSEVEFLLTAEPIIDGDSFAGFVGTASSPGSDGPEMADDGRFIERLSEALRAPLDAIVTNATNIATQSDGPLRRDYADYAGDIASAGRHLLALVDDLADLDAVERPDFVLMGEPVDLADIARRAAGLLSVRASDRQVRIDRPDDDEVLQATGDFRRVLQILVNLIGNAVRYSPAGGMVWLRTEHEDGLAVVIVADQGKGIAVEHQARIFDKFERVDPTEAEGSGLGLYISRRLARAMGGDITVDSAPGQGARFMLTLPNADGIS